MDGAHSSASRLVLAAADDGLQQRAVAEARAERARLREGALEEVAGGGHGRGRGAGGGGRRSGGRGGSRGGRRRDLLGALLGDGDAGRERRRLGDLLVLGEWGLGLLYECVLVRRLWRPQEQQGGLCIGAATRITRRARAPSSSIQAPLAYHTAPPPLTPVTPLTSPASSSASLAKEPSR